MTRMTTDCISCLACIECENRYCHGRKVYIYVQNL